MTPGGGLAALITCAHLQRGFDAHGPEFAKRGVAAHLPELLGQQFDAEAMARMLPEADVVIAGDDIIDAEALRAGKAGRLKAVIKWGIGTDAIDKVAAAELGLPVYNTPGVFGDEVADLAMTFMLLLARPLHLIDRSVRGGGWRQIQGRSLKGLTAGVVGFGSIGQAIAQRCSGFGLSVLAHDTRDIEAAALERSGAASVGLEELFERADCLFLACALTPDNRHMVSRDRLRKMKRGAYVVNVARGALVDEAALIDALEANHLGGAGLDVYEAEPLPADSGLRQFDNVILGSHCGSNTAEAIARINAKTVGMLWPLLSLEPMDERDFNRVA